MSSKKYGGVHASSKDCDFLMSLTSFGYIQCWSPCSIQKKTRLNDVFRTGSGSSGSKTSEDVTTTKESTGTSTIEMNGMAFQGFVEIDPELDMEVSCTCNLKSHSLNT